MIDRRDAFSEFVNPSHPVELEQLKGQLNAVRRSQPAQTPREATLTRPTYQSRLRPVYRVLTLAAVLTGTIGGIGTVAVMGYQHDAREHRALDALVHRATLIGPCQFDGQLYSSGQVQPGGLYVCTRGTWLPVEPAKPDPAITVEPSPIYIGGSDTITASRTLQERSSWITQVDGKLVVAGKCGTLTVDADSNNAIQLTPTHAKGCK